MFALGTSLPHTKNHIFSEFSDYDLKAESIDKWDQIKALNDLVMITT